MSTPEQFTTPPELLELAIDHSVPVPPDEDFRRWAINAANAQNKRSYDLLRTRPNPKADEEKALGSIVRTTGYLLGPTAMRSRAEEKFQELRTKGEPFGSSELGDENTNGRQWKLTSAFVDGYVSALTGELAFREAHVRFSQIGHGTVRATTQTTNP